MRWGVEMKAAPRIGLVGTGRLASILAMASAPRFETLIWGRNKTALDALCLRAPGLRAASLKDVAKADLVVLAIPPEAYAGMLADVAPLLDPRAVMVSVTNGAPLSAIGSSIPNPVVKAIPTVAQSVSRGVPLIVKGPRASDGDVERVRVWLSAFGAPMLVEEADIRVASNAAGSAVALMAEFAAAFARANAARAVGLSRAEMERMLAETLGAIGDLARAGLSFADMASMTATPGGVTEAALQILRAEADALCARMVDATFIRQADLQTHKSDSTSA